MIAAAADLARVPMPSHDVYRQRLLGAVAHGDADRDQAVLAREQARAAGWSSAPPKRNVVIEPSTKRISRSSTRDALGHGVPEEEDGRGHVHRLGPEDTGVTAA